MRRLLISYLFVLGFAASGDALAELLGADVEQAVLQYVEGRLPDMPVSQGAKRVEVKVHAVDRRMRLADCLTPLQLESSEFQGYGRLTIHVRCHEPHAWQVYVPVTVSVFRDAVVAVHPLARGEIVEQDKLAVSEVDVLQTKGRHLEDPASAVGQQARRTIPAGGLVTDAMLQAPTLVKRGEEVRVIARRGSVAVQVTATALSNGRLGEQIRVRNEQSERVIKARVLGPGEVEVIL